MALIDEINNNQVILIIINKSEYIEKSVEIVKTLGGIDQKTCYVALNKPYNSIILNMQKNDIDSNKFFFIDVLTATVQTPPEVTNCLFVESPNAITDLSLSFSKAMFEVGCENALFDAVSNLLIHQDQASVIKLTQNLMTKVRVGGKKAIFIALKEDSEQLIKDLTMFVDAIVNL